MAIAGYITRGIGASGTVPQFLLRGLNATTSLTGGSTGYEYPTQAASTTTYTYTT